MNDLISRKWLMECVDEGWIKFDTEKDKNTYVHLVRDIAPSAQPQQIVRCKDCKHNYGLTHGGEFNPEDIVCTYFDTDGMQCYDFCSYAERI